jgi:hypothetical protein
MNSVHGRSWTCFRLRLARADAMLGNDFVGVKLVFYVMLVITCKGPKLFENDT